MKKFAIGFVLFFLVYTLAVWLYLFVGADQALPQQYQGSAADPQTFMNATQIELSQEYSKIRNMMFFVSIPLEWGIYLFVLVFGLSRLFQDWATGVSRFSFIRASIFVFLLSIVSFVLTFPLDYVRFYFAHEFNISTQTFSSWMKDNLIQFWISALFMTLTAWVIYFFIHKTGRRWWLYTWLVSIPFTIFLTFIQPVVIDPLYNDFYPLQDKQLEEKILAYAEQADIPADRVFEVNMSSKTNALNAYVTGIGSNLRIVLWDTTLQQLTEDEVLFVMAHEMGHYTMNHLYWNVFSMIVLSFFGLYLGSRLLSWMVHKWGHHWRVNRVGDIASLPALLLILSLLTFAVSPLENAISRKAEYDADRYAIQMTQDAQGAIGAFQQLTITGLSEVNPPTLVKLFRYSHPPMLERLYFLETYNPKRK